MTIANLSRADAEARARLIGVETYDISLDLSQGESADTFRSRTELTFISRDPSQPTFVDVIAESLSLVTLNGVAVDTSGHGTRARSH